MMKIKFLLRGAPVAFLFSSFSGQANAAGVINPAPAYTATQDKGITLWEKDYTAIGLLGDLRLTTNVDSQKSQEHKIKNNDSRLGVAVRHNFAGSENYLATYGEIGVKGLDSATEDQNSEVYMRQLYGAIGNDTYGLVSFGKQYSPADWALGVDTTYQYGGKSKHDTTGMSTDIVSSSAIYTYFGDNLDFGLMVQGNEDVDNIGFASGWGTGLSYHSAFTDGASQVHSGLLLGGTWHWDSGVSVSAAAGGNRYTVDGNAGTGGYSGNTYSTGANIKYRGIINQNEFYAGAQVTYYVNQVDNASQARVGDVYIRSAGTANNKESILSFEGNLQYRILDNWHLYGDYTWSQGQDAMEGQKLSSAVAGIDYWFNNTAVVYCEYAYQTYRDEGQFGNTHNHLGALGLRIFI